MRMILLAAIGLIASPAAAITDPASIDMRVAAFAGAMPGQDGGARTTVDRRLQLADCAGDPKLSWRTDRHDAIVVECGGPIAWRIFVPVLRSSASAPVQSASFAMEPARAAKADPVIRRGDAVTIGVDSGGFTVSQDGVAMADAAPGERLKIKVDGKKDPVQAVAVAAGQAVLPSA